MASLAMPYYVEPQLREPMSRWLKQDETMPSRKDPRHWHRSLTAIEGRCSCDWVIVTQRLRETVAYFAARQLPTFQEPIICAHMGPMGRNTFGDVSSNTENGIQRQSCRMPHSCDRGASVPLALGLVSWHRDGSCGP
jgi:hypothetical protein